MFTGSRIVINDGNFIQTTSASAENRGFSLLTEAASPSAFHDAFHFSLPTSHSNSQSTVLKGWISDNTAVPVMWLYGAAGAGKSSLAQSIALWCEQESLLLASFFFSRSDPSRNNIHRFIPTLAYSIIQVIPESRRMIEQAVDSDPHIFSRSLDAQISRLVLRPLLTLAQTLTSNGSRPLPHVLVVDGLDECQDETAQKTILRLFSSDFSGWDLGWKVLITSRPEQAIRISFDSMHLSTRLALSNGCSPGNTTSLPNIAPSAPSSNAQIQNTGITYRGGDREQGATLNDNERSGRDSKHVPFQDVHQFRHSPYQGQRRKLVLAFDVGTTFSRISYSILSPGQVPKVNHVSRFPGHEHISGAPKIPSIIYYDCSGRVRAVGTEATTGNALEHAEEEQWIKAEWFKLHLRNKVGSGKNVTNDIPPLPLNKSVVEVFAHFLEYLFQCAEDYIKETHANGPALWKSIKSDIAFVLPHPDAKEGMHLQQQMRRAAVLAKLIPDTTSGHARLSLVTEGEASLHFCIQNCLPVGAMKNGDGVVIVDAGEGTIDISSYCRMGEGFKEISAPQCYFHGSTFVTLLARTFLDSFLVDSPFHDDLNHIVSCFDKTTKHRFRNSKDYQYVKFGSTRDNDEVYNIRFGQLKLQGSDVAMFFEPSIDCIVNAVLDRRKIKPIISHVVLLGSFAANDWLYNNVQVQLERQGLSVFRPNHNVDTAVSDGAISFYLAADWRTTHP